MNPGREHIVGSAHPSDRAAFDGPQLLLERHDVRHHLAGMRKLGEAVDDGDGRVVRKLAHHFVVEQADHHGVDIARDHARRVRDGFLARQLHFRAREHDGRAAKLAHADIEGDARARGLLVEDEREHAALQRRIRIGRAMRQAPRAHPCDGALRRSATSGCAESRSARSMKCRGLSTVFTGAFMPPPAFLLSLFANRIPRRFPKAAASLRAHAPLRRSAAATDAPHCRLRGIASMPWARRRVMKSPARHFHLETQHEACRRAIPRTRPDVPR